MPNVTARRVCSVEGCGRPSKARGLCQGHAARLKRGGQLDPDRPLGARIPRADRTCVLPDCQTLLNGGDAHGMCAMHYRRQRLYGDPNTVQVVRHRGGPQERFWAKVNKTETCWLWTASLSPDGYGSFGSAGSTIRAHRQSWIWKNGPVPYGLELDHLCAVRACVRPDHLEPVSHTENVARAWQRREATDAGLPSSVNA